MAVALAFGCGGKKDEGGEGDEPAQQDDAPAFGGGNPFANLGAFGSLLSARANTPGPYDEPVESEDFDDDEDHFAIVELSGAVVELESFDWFGGGGGIELRVIGDKLAELAEDEHVVGLVLRLGGVELDMATAEELRGALVAFKTAGARERSLVCHVEDAANLGYYLLTACDHVALAPTGSIMVSGAAAMPIHVKGLLAKLGVTADFIHIGAFKGAAEPLTRDAPSKEMLETLQALMDEQYGALVDAIASGRRLKPARVRALIDRAVFPDADALDAGLVDQVAVFEAYRDERVGKAHWRVFKLQKQEESNLSTIMEFIGMTPASRPSGPHVAVVYAVGSVIDGRGEGLLGARGEIASRTLAAALRALAKDDSVRAVVLRVSSPGGSALASELILHALSEVKAKKPVVVSMGGVAASGGYYIACRANKIFASPNTITGSIGVVGGKIVIGEALANIGVAAHPMGKGKRALMWSMIDEWSPDERKAVRDMMQSTYETFVTHVAEGRGKSYKQIHAIAQGRVWTGVDALERGLVDQLGGLDAAIAEARVLGEVPAGAGLEIYPPEPTLFDILGSFGEVSLPYGLDSAAVSIARELGPEAGQVAEQLFGQLVRFRDTPVQAVMLLPVVMR
jgi:protease-4